MASPAQTFLEIACFNVESVFVAVRAGADRIEFCRDYVHGGLTPKSTDLDAIRDALPASQVPINVMIRSRPGTDFRVSKEEAEHIKTEIRLLGPQVSGFVFGFLDDEGFIDYDLNWDLVKFAYPKPCTFHRAFDHAKGSLYDKLETVRRSGFTTILTSGGPGNAVDGVANLRRLVDMAKPLEMTIMVGGGVRSSNIQHLMHETGAQAFHTAAITKPNGENPDAKEIERIMQIVKRSS